MKLFNRLDRYLLDNEYKVTVMGRKIHIINYVEIEDFSSDKVVIVYKGGKTVLKGEDLVVSKMMDDELLIVGKLNCIEYK